MAYENEQERESFPAGESLATDQFKPVYKGSDGMIYNDDTGGRVLIGVLQDNPAIVGQAGCVCLSGTSKYVFSGSKAANTYTTEGWLVLEGVSGAGVGTVLVTKASAPIVHPEAT